MSETLESTRDPAPWPAAFGTWPQTRWAADQIQVMVNRCIVTLTGSVDFWSERNTAGRIAQQTSDVRGVDNQISVSGYNYDWNAG